MKRAWMPLYCGDYLADTAHLTQGKHGAYLLLIMYYWQRGSLPPQKLLCYGIARANTKREYENVDAVLNEFFKFSEIGYSHKRIDKELAHMIQVSEKRADAARQRKIVMSKCSANAKQMDTHSHSHSHLIQDQDQKHVHAQFKAPTIEELRETVAKLGIGIDCDAFFDHYSANGWKVGRNPMKSVNAAIRNWKRNEGKYGTKGVSPSQRRESDTRRAITNVLRNRVEQRTRSDGDKQQQGSDRGADGRVDAPLLKAAAGSD